MRVTKTAHCCLKEVLLLFFGVILKADSCVVLETGCMYACMSSCVSSLKCYAAPVSCGVECMLEMVHGEKCETCFS